MGEYRGEIPRDNLTLENWSALVGQAAKSHEAAEGHPGMMGGRKYVCIRLDQEGQVESLAAMTKAEIGKTGYMMLSTRTIKEFSEGLLKDTEAYQKQYNPAEADLSGAKATLEAHVTLLDLSHRQGTVVQQEPVEAAEEVPGEAPEFGDITLEGWTKVLTEAAQSHRVADRGSGRLEDQPALEASRKYVCLVRGEGGGPPQPMALTENEMDNTEHCQRLNIADIDEISTQVLELEQKQNRNAELGAAKQQLARLSNHLEKSHVLESESEEEESSDDEGPGELHDEGAKAGVVPRAEDRATPAERELKELKQAREKSPLAAPLLAQQEKEMKSAGAPLVPVRAETMDEVDKLLAAVRARDAGQAPPSAARAPVSAAVLASPRRTPEGNPIPRSLAGLALLVGALAAYLFTKLAIFLTGSSQTRAAAPAAAKGGASAAASGLASPAAQQARATLAASLENAVKNPKQTENERRFELTTLLEEDYKKTAEAGKLGAGNVKVFNDTAKRGMGFIRDDQNNSKGPIQDQVAVRKSSAMSDEEAVEQHSKALEELLGHDDEAWRLPLQAALTHNSNPLQTPVGDFINSQSRQNVVTWKDPSTGQDHNMAVLLSRDPQPIKVKVNRGRNGEIVSVNIQTRVAFDLSNAPAGGGTRTFLQSNIAYTDQSYTLTLGKNGAPVVSDLRLQHHYDPAVATALATMQREASKILADEETKAQHQYLKMNPGKGLPADPATATRTARNELTRESAQEMLTTNAAPAAVSKEYPQVEVAQDRSVQVQHQFARDAKGFVSYQRHDGAIDDDSPVVAPAHLPEAQRVSHQAVPLAALVRAGDNQAWLPALQGLATQDTLIRAIGPQMNALNAVAREQQWDDNRFSLSYETPATMPPIDMTVNRDASGRITSVDVKATATINLIQKRIKWDDGQSPDDFPTEVAVVKKDALVNTLTYRVTLDHNNQPVISNLNLTSTAS